MGLKIGAKIARDRIDLPMEPYADLPREDQVAIAEASSFEVAEIDELAGVAELEFVDPKGTIHTLFVALAIVEAAFDKAALRAREAKELAKASLGKRPELAGASFGLCAGSDGAPAVKVNLASPAPQGMVPERILGVELVVEVAGKVRAR